MGGAVAAIAIGVGLFMVLRARSVVEGTWDLRPARSPGVIVALAVAIVVLVFVAPGLLAVLAGAGVIAGAQRRLASASVRRSSLAERTVGGRRRSCCLALAPPEVVIGAERTVSSARGSARHQSSAGEYSSCSASSGTGRGTVGLGRRWDVGEVRSWRGGTR
jgi:hypothetical protein